MEIEEMVTRHLLAERNREAVIRLMSPKLVTDALGRLGRLGYLLDDEGGKRSIVGLKTLCGKDFAYFCDEYASSIYATSLYASRHDSNA